LTDVLCAGDGDFADDDAGAAALESDGEIGDDDIEPEVDGELAEENDAEEERTESPDGQDDQEGSHEESPDELELNAESYERQIAHEEFDTRSEASSDRGDIYENISDPENENEPGQSPKRNRAISPIVFDRDDSSSEDDFDENDDDIAPPGESDVPIPKKEIILPPLEVRAERRERHTKMLKYLLREAHFYIIKSNNFENVSLSKAKGVWSTPPSNEAKINRSFNEARNVILVFSVRESGAFQGFARLSSEVRHDVSPINWVLPPGLSARALGGVFHLDWLCRRELSFAKTVDIHNSFNQNRPVKIGRDGQEVEPNAGRSLCLEFPHDDKVDLEGIIQRVRKQQKAAGGPPKYRPPQPLLDSPLMRERGRDRPPFDPRRGGRRGGGFVRRGNFRGRAMRSNFRSPRPRGFSHGNRRPPSPLPNGHYSHPPPTNYSAPPHRPQQVFQPETFSSYNPYPSYDSYPTQQPAPPPKYTQNSSSAHVSSRVSGSSSRLSFDSVPLTSRIYDSRSHAAACDDFVRRVAGGKSISSAISYRSSSSRSSDNYSRSRRRSPARSSERRSSYRR